jgi:hypothetical protein
MSSIRPGPNSHQGMGGPPSQPYSGPPPSQQRPNGYQVSSLPPSGPPPPHPPPAGSPGYNTVKQITDANVAVYMDIARLAESIEDHDRAKSAYENVLKYNHDNLAAKKALGLLYKDKYKNNEKVCIQF